MTTAIYEFEKTGRKWLDTAIASEYLPFIESVRNSSAGRKKLTQFVQSMREDWAARRRLVSTEQQANLMNGVRNAIKANLGDDHWSLDIVKFSSEEWIQLNNQRQDKTATRNENVRFIDNPEDLTAIAVRLLKSPEWSEIVAGLSLLTGRRVAELIASAQFEKKTQWSVIFTGALKRRGEAVELSFEIPTLTTADNVIAALKRVRKALPEAADLSPAQINRTYERAVSSACDKHFQGKIPLRPGKDSLYTHMNRAIYSTIATFWYCPPAVQEMEFKATIQGHYAILDEANPDKRRTLASSRHYSDYEIADKLIEQHKGKRKGIKLGYGGIVPIEAFKDAGAAKEGEIAPSLFPKRLRSSIPLYRDLLPRWNAVMMAIAPEGNQQQRTEILLQWIEHQLEAQKNPPAIDQTKSEALAKVEQSGVDLSNPELRSLIQAIVMETIQGQISPPAEPSPEKPKPEKQPKADGDAAPATRGRRSTPDTEEKVLTAIDRIMEYNNTPNRLHDDKWEITIRSLKALGAAQSAVYRIMPEKQQAIDAHHNQHQIAPNHNARHRKKKLISDVIKI
ncbi:MAG: protelomerase family protein [Nodosilinea sp.]